MRMIDADALKEKKVYSRERREYVVPVCEIDWQPTIDAVPAVHGHWIETVYQSVMLLECKCSICGVKDFGMNLPKYYFERKYCPYCGAKMDEEVSDGTD